MLWGSVCRRDEGGFLRRTLISLQSKTLLTKVNPRPPPQLPNLSLFELRENILLCFVKLSQNRLPMLL